MPAGVVGGREAKIAQAKSTYKNSSSSLLIERKALVKISEEQANLIESAEKSWFILGVSPYFYNLPQLFFRQEWLVPIVLL